MSAPVVTQPDPFDTSQFWPSNHHASPRPSYDFTISEANNISHPQESHRYSTNNRVPSISTDTHIYNNTPSTSGATHANNSPYGALPTSYAMNNSISLERNNVPSVATSLANMSLDDRISESLNLRSKSNNSDYPYGEPTYNAPSTSAVNNMEDNKYNDIPLYKNYEMHPAQQQFILETKDYYTKLSTPTKTNTNNDYEKNIYIPKYEEEGEKLRNFSDCVENSKNYSAYKYQNVDYGNYSNYAVYGNASTSRGEALYDEVNDTASVGGNLYSEVGEPAPLYSNCNVYDQVAADPPRPHRPAPPCPATHK